MKSHFVEALEKISKASESGALTLRQIFDLLGEKGHLILTLLLIGPFMQPVPLFGLSTPLGVLIIIVSFYFLRQEPPWLPKKFADLAVSKAILDKTIEVILKIWGYLEKMLKPRWPRLHDASGFRMFNFILVVTSAFLLALPLPIPFTNTVPAVPIVLNTIGLLEEDGVVVFLSYLFFVFCLAFFIGLGAGVFVGVAEYYDKILPLLGF